MALVSVHGCTSCHVCGRCTICGCDHAKSLPTFAETAAHWERLFGVVRAEPTPATRADAFRLDWDLALLGANVRDENGRHVPVSEWPSGREWVEAFRAIASPPLSFIGAAANGGRS